MNKHEHTLGRRHFLGLASALAFGSAFSLSACNANDEGQNEAGQKGNAAQVGIDYANFEEVVAAARGTKVSWYGWGGSEPRNTWINETLVPLLKDKYDLTLELVGMDINDILTKLSGEMQAGVTEGSIDFIWINGENFFSTKQNGYLWGPFTDYLPNFRDYIDATSPEVLYDFGSPTEGFEAPYGKAQMQMWVDSAKVSSIPKNPEEFLQFCKDNPGKVSYPQPGDFIGTAFISTLIAGVVGKEKFEELSKMNEPTIEAVQEVVQAGLDYLKELSPYLWKEGKTYPADSGALASMYADGEVVLNMGYGDPQVQVNEGSIPSTTKSFLFETGTVGNSNFMAIAQNAKNIAGALVAINEIMSPEMQYEQYEKLGNITVLDLNMVSEEIKEKFESKELGSAQLPVDELLSNRIAEAAGPVIPLLEQLWRDQVPPIK
ncbi:MAG: ABC transporter substrate-binding protein [Coriobacteriia bacterium]|nr:ABC transporter substrate-binding protein [Coriobacteriia bacterium]